jgi:hypothetical protein
MALPCLIAVWMISGFYLSLGPSLAAQVLRSPDLLWGGMVIFLVAGTGGAASVAGRALSPPSAMLAGCLALLAGAVMTVARSKQHRLPRSWSAPRWRVRASAPGSSRAPTAS